MPTTVTRDKVRDLVAAGAQLVEVLPADEYRWAHLPGAINLPLKELDAHTDQLDRSRPVIVYCHDTVQDMSPRAACRLEAAGFTSVYDYTDGKADWLAADLPFEGEAVLVGSLTRRQVPTVSDDATVAAARAQAEAVGFGPVVVLNPAGIVVGTVRAEQLEQAGAGTPVADGLRFGISTVRPSEEVAELLHRMAHRSVTRVVVTRSDGGLVGLFFAEDAPPAGKNERGHS